MFPRSPVRFRPADPSSARFLPPSDPLVRRASVSVLDASRQPCVSAPLGSRYRDGATLGRCCRPLQDTQEEALRTFCIRETPVHSQPLKYQSFSPRLLSLSHAFGGKIPPFVLRRSYQPHSTKPVTVLVFFFFFAPLPSRPVCLGELSQTVTPTRASHPHLAP